MTHDAIPPFASAAVAAAFQAFPDDVRDIALALRTLILDVARETPEAGPLEESLRWGQPAYLTTQTKSGSTLRIGVLKSGDAAIFAHCATTIIGTYAATFPGMDQIEGNRAVAFSNLDAVVPERLRLLIRHGLTYHLPSA